MIRMTKRAYFDGRLESMRGIAVLIVAMHIGSSAFPIAQIGDKETLPLIFSWTQALPSANAAVTFFFVLSGYVLGNSVVRPVNFFVYSARRALRILPMFVVSVFFAFLCIRYIRVEHQPTDLTAFFSRAIFPGPTVDQLLDNLLMRSAHVNVTSWSIWPELVGSIFMVLLVNLHRSLPFLNSWTVVTILSTILAFTGFRVVVWFYLGFFLVPWFAAFISGSRLAPIAAFCIGYLVLQFTVLELDFTYSSRFVVPTSIGASLMIAAIVSNSTFFTWLEAPPLRLIGRISYSFYLLCWPIFYLCWVAYMQTNLPHGIVGNIIICSTSIVFTLIASYFSYEIVERPLIKIGRELLEDEESKREQMMIVESS